MANDRLPKIEIQKLKPSVNEIISGDVIAHIQGLLVDIQKRLGDLDNLEGEYALGCLDKADRELTALCNYLTKE